LVEGGAHCARGGKPLNAKPLNPAVERRLGGGNQEGCQKADLILSEAQRKEEGAQYGDREKGKREKRKELDVFLVEDLEEKRANQGGEAAISH